MSTYEVGIDRTLIPQTIRDAIYVTNALGFRWLWVDSLCIIQDSDQDKGRELARMHYIYRYAHLTIIAASAERVDEGFLQDRPPPPQVNFNEPFSSADLILPFICPSNSSSAAEGPKHSAMTRQVGEIRIATRQISHFAGALWPNRGSDDLEPISTRGWCMQEYLMSPRLLIFTSKTLQFRCLTTTQNVGNSLRDTIEEWRIPSTLFLKDPPLAEHGSAEWDDVHGEWLGVLGDYSRRTTSLPSDKLVACAAVAEQFHRVLRSDYLAGVWRHSLLLDLLWCAAQGKHLYRPVEYRTPSWSWAAVEGELAWRARGPGEMMVLDEDAFAKVVRCEVTIKDPALPFGQVTGGSLVLRAPLLGCILRLEGRGPGSRHDILLQPVREALDLGSDGPDVDDAAGVEANPKLAGIACIDCDVDAEIEGAWAVPIFPRGAPGYRQWMEGLVVSLATPGGSDSVSDHGTATYRRLGYYSFTFESRSILHGDFDEIAHKELARALKEGKYPLVDIELV
ncbi:hypothetical protein TRAPUB_13254 [Trametes pubescens]|uniref:Heterokaryon incompatibility domain-containing protein n=1 Tax=Trametes pubescens TaxID=154538 RepID=A0A1M2VRJ8_TRAPU|nr:hypothetical protein TRAPUB_13254 [Trametes pubescens]